MPFLDDLLTLGFDGLYLIEPPMDIEASRQICHRARLIGNIDSTTR